jgi:hypothetical protein
LISNVDYLPRSRIATPSLSSSRKKTRKMEFTTLQYSTLSKIPSLIDDGTSTLIFLDDDDSASCRRRSSLKTCKHHNWAPRVLLQELEDVVDHDEKSSPPTQQQTKAKTPSDRINRPLSQAVQYENGNAAHLFLSYAGKLNTAKTMKTENPAKNIRAPGHRRASSWGSSLDDFELECDLFLQTNQKLPQDRASAISKALKRVAQGTPVESDSSVDVSECRNSRFASYLRAALSTKHDKDNAEMRSNPFDHDSNPAKAEEDSPREQLQRQREEIQFLRSTVKELVHSDNAERRDPMPCQREGLQNEIFDTKEEPLIETRASIPRSIQIRCLEPVVDDLTEGQDARSDFTPSEDGVICFPKTPPETPRHQASPVRIFDFDISVSRISSSKAPPTAVPTFSSHGRVPSRRHHPDRVSFPDMAKGEIQDKRARGMLCNINFQSWGIVLQGRYIGTLRNGQPNGTGVLRFHNRDYYVGAFRGGMIHGEGALFLRRNGRLLKFRGQFERNEFVGWKWEKPTTTPSNTNTRMSIGHQPALISP